MAEVVNVRGLLVVQQRALLRDRIGEDAFGAVLAELDPFDRRTYEEATALSWCPQPVVRRVTRRVAERAGIEPEHLAAQVVRESVAKACRGPWAVLLRFTSQEALVRRTGMLFARAFDRGDVTATWHGDGSGTVRLTGWPSPDPMDVASLRAGIAAVLAAAGWESDVTGEVLPDGLECRVRTWVSQRASRTD